MILISSLKVLTVPFLSVKCKLSSVNKICLAKNSMSLLAAWNMVSLSLASDCSRYIQSCYVILGKTDLICHLNTIIINSPGCQGLALIAGFCLIQTNATHKMTGSLNSARFASCYLSTRV